MRLPSSIAAKLALGASLVAAAPPRRRQFGPTPDVTVIPEITPEVVFKDYELVIDNTAVAPDGFLRNGTVAGLPGQPGTFPGPTLTANRGESLRIKLRNELVDPTMRRSTSIHWHGLFQNETAEEDGAAFITQCPIGPDPGANEYTHEIPLHEQTGTFWYHGHVSSQYVDGLRGALVIYDQTDREVYDYDVDDEGTIIQFGDWYHKPTSILLNEFFSPDNGGGQEPVADVGTINGRGRCSARAPNPADCPQDVPWARINVRQGQKYRMRLINNSAFGHFHVRFEGHPMTVIEADGILHQPLVRDEVEIYAAQRYSVIIDANQPVGNYWIYAPMEMKGASSNPNLDKDRILAVLHYEGAPDADPTSVPILPTVDARTADILEDAEIEFDAVKDALETSGASRESIQNHLAFVKAFKKIEDDEDEACEPDDDPQYCPLPPPSFDTLDPATLAIALAAEANIKAILEAMCAENADPAYIATQRRILAGFQSIRDGTFSCNGANGSTSRSFSSLKEFELVPLRNPEVPGGAGPADHVVELNYRRDTNGTGSVAWLINGIQWQPPNPPTLLQILSTNARNANDFAQSSNTIILNRGDIVELRVQGSNNGVYHPFHLHGHTFSVVKGKDGPPNYVNAPQRDVSAVGGGGAIFRFMATNPGPWFFHCHIDWHLDAGLAVIFAEAPADIPGRVIPDAQWDQLCPIYNALPADKQ